MVARTFRILCIAAVVLIAGSIVSAADEVLLDLAAPTEVLTRTVEPGPATIKVVNLIPPTNRYRVSIIRRSVIAPGINIDDVGDVPFSLGGSDKVQSVCERAIADLRKTIGAAVSEESVADHLRGAVHALQKAGCGAQQVTSAIVDLQRQTTLKQVVNVRQGETVEFSISRPEAGTDKRVEWLVRLDTKPRGTWLTTYGFAIEPTRDERFFLRPTVTAGEFEVAAAERRRHEYRPAPAVLLVWLPEAESLEDWSDGPTVGFGVKDDNLVAFAGWSVLYNTVLQLSAGLAIVPSQRLTGSLREGQIVREALTEEQLHRRTHVLAPAATISVRFGGNPFKDRVEDVSKTKAGDGQKPS